MNIDPIPAPTDGHALDAQIQRWPAAAASVVDGGPINILIVDDEPKNLTVLETVLDDPGYRLVRAESADQALLALVVEEFALLILDIRMPGMTGFELAQMIKDRKKTAQVPIIFLTAYYNEDQHVLEGYGTGAVDYLHKPVNSAILRSKVAVFAELHRKNRECGMANRALLAEVTDRRRAEEQLRELNETLEQRVTERTEALNAGEERYRTLFDSAPMAIFVCDRNAVIRQYNPRAAALWGREPASGVERHCGSAKLWLPDGSHLPHAQSPVMDVLRTGLPVNNLEVFIERPDGSRLPVLVNFVALMDARGEVTGAVTSFIDITERKEVEDKLRESEARKAAVVNSSLDGIITIDHEGAVIEFNPAAEQTFGYRREEVLGREMAALIIPPTLRESHRMGLARFLATGEGPILGQRLELTALRSDGTEFPVEVAISRINMDGPPLFSGYIRDITERNRLEAMLREQTVKLSDLHRRKDEFLAMLSHELRNPLAAIANAVQLLGLEPRSETQIQQQARGIIERQMNQLQHLVDDLLEVSRITTGRVQLRREPVVVSDIVERAVETVRPLIEQRQHELTVSLPPEPIWLHADAARLQQVLVNLLANAAKFTEEGGHVWLTVEREEDKEKEDSLSVSFSPPLLVAPSDVFIRVRDTGPGITPELLPHIFDLFTQAERSLDRSQGGLGIGLALVQRLTELHEGTVEASSVLGRGSEFVVRLPVPPTDASLPTSPETETGQPETRPLRVLVVDDNADTVLSFTMLLKTSGHNVRTAHDGPTALEVALDYRPDVVLLDIGLPGLNGFEVAKRLRQQPEFKDLVLVALTGYGQASDRQTSLQAGFDHHLVKPARLAQLQQILATVSEKVTSDQ